MYLKCFVKNLDYSDKAGKIWQFRFTTKFVVKKATNYPMLSKFLKKKY